MNQTPETPNPFRSLGIAVGTLFVAVLYGTVGYMIIEHAWLFDALYMTLITISSVGYGEMVVLDFPGRVFTITLIIFGVLGFLYTFGVIVELLSGSNEWQTFRRSRRSNRVRERLRDHVIVCGYGRIGRQVVNELRASGRPYVIVEQNPALLAAEPLEYTSHLVGDATSDGVLQTAGVERAAALVTALEGDERNVYIALTARNLNPDLFIVARSSSPEAVTKMHRAGADRVVSPDALSGRRMAMLARQHDVVDVFDMALAGDHPSVRIEQQRVPDVISPTVTVGTVRRSGVVVLAMHSAAAGLMADPGDDEKLAGHDLIVAMGTPEQLQVLASALGQPDAAGQGVRHDPSPVRDP